MPVTMTRSLSTVCALAIAAALSACATGGADPTVAASNTNEPAAVERRFTQEMGTLALEAQAQMQAGDDAAASETLERAFALGPTTYERFMLLNMRAEMYGVQEPALAVADWLEMLTLGVATPEEAASLNVNIGQLMIAAGQIDEGVMRLESWLAMNAPRESIVMMVATALAQDGQLNRALPYAALAEDLAMPVQDRHLDLLVYLYGQLDMPEQREQTLRRKETLARPASHTPS